MKSINWPVAIMLLAFSVSGYGADYGDWKYSAAPDVLMSYTTNDKGDRLASNCFIGVDQCYVTFKTADHDCSESYQEFPITAYTKGKAFGMDAVCMLQPDGDYMLFLSKTTVMIDLMASEKGVSVLLTGKEPSRFSLYGANESLNYLYDTFTMIEK